MPHTETVPSSLVRLVAQELAPTTRTTAIEQTIKTLLPSSQEMHNLHESFLRMPHENGWLVYSFREEMVTSSYLGPIVSSDEAHF